MVRIALEIAYSGVAYHGWQNQKNACSIQAKLDDAISKVANELIETTCAGRTDAGVHATKQIIHFDTEAKRTTEQWLLGVNSHLPKDIRVEQATSVSSDFHARFSAIKRQYTYVILNQKISPTILLNHVTWHAPWLDVEKMHTAAQCLLGEHDFTSFRASGCQSKSKHRNVEAISITQKGRFIVFEITANAFLYHMVRNIAGSLLKIGEGSEDVSWLGTLLAAKNRQLAAPTASPCGLYLTNVIYPEFFNLNNELRHPVFLC